MAIPRKHQEHDNQVHFVHGFTVFVKLCESEQYSINFQ
jgi:hypothetical protein